jgi:hypothetical protein
MYSSLMVLAALTATPSPAGEPPLLYCYQSNQREMSRLHWQTLRLTEEYQETSVNVAKQITTLYNSNAPLLARVLTWRQAVREADLACHKAGSLARLWEAECQCRPTTPGVRDDLHFQQNRLYRHRALARAALYREFIQHRWSWEGDGEDYCLNYRCVSTLADLFGYQGDWDRLTVRVGWAEAYLTEVWPFLR